MERKTVILLYSGDPWLSRSSLTLEGVYSDEASLGKSVHDMLSRGLINRYGYDCLLGRNGSNNRTAEMADGTEGMFCIEIRNLNEPIE